MNMLRVASVLFLAALAACDPETKIEYVEVPGPPAPPAPPSPEITDLAVNVVASQITGPITLNGGAFPVSQYEKGDVVLQGAHSHDLLMLGQTLDQSYATFVVNGSYDFRYLFGAGGDVVPTNESAEIISDRAVAGNAAIPVDVGAVRVSAVFTLNGSAFPASQYDGAKFYLQRVGSEDLILLGESQQVNAPVKIVAGNYHVIYDYRAGDVSPINKRARVQQNVALTANQVLQVNVLSGTVRPTFSLNGSPFPQSEYNDANFYLRDKLTGAESLLKNSHDAAVGVIAIDGTYDVIYRHESGSLVPINKAAVVVSNFVSNGGGAIVRDIGSVPINATVTLNHSPFPVSEYQDGNILLHDALTNTDTELGSTHSPFSNLLLIPGTYDVLYSHESGDQVPQNVRGTVAKNVVVNNANLNIDVTGIQVGANITLNGAAFPVSEYDDANFVLEGALSAKGIVIGSSHDQSPSVMVLPGTYDLLYRHESGDEVPRNGNYRLLASQALTASTTLSTDIHTRFVRLSATLNDAPFPGSLLNSARIFARSREDDDVLMLRTHGIQHTPMLIVGDYELYYQHTKGSNVPRNPWAKVGQASVD